MGKHARFCRLISALINLHYLTDGNNPEALDCAMSCPEAAIPDQPSLTEFATLFLRHFFAYKDCKSEYHTAADHIDKWKAEWTC